MGRKKSLFSGGSRSISAQVIEPNNRLDEQKPGSSKAALEKNKVNSKVIPAVDLKGSIQIFEGGKHGTYFYDLADLVERFPHHEPLIRQLLTGVPLAKNGVSRKSAALPFACIYDFVEFLNDPQNLSNTRVSVVSDITVTVCRAFSGYLISRFPRRPANAKRYSALRNVVTALQQKFSHDSRIGPILDWPSGPRTIVNARRGYDPQCIGELVAACQRDIEETIRLHAIYQSAQDGEPIRLEEWNLPNLMFYLREKLGKVRATSVADFLRRSIKHSPYAQNFLLKEGCTVEDIAILYETRGVELAKTGRYPGEREEDWTVNNFMVWVQRKWKRRISRYRFNYGAIRKFISSTPCVKRFVEGQGYSPDDIVTLYSARGEELANLGRNPFGQRFDTTGENAEQQLGAAIATLAQQYPDYPFGMSVEAATDFLSWERGCRLAGKDSLASERPLLWTVHKTRLNFSGSKFSGVNLVRAAMHFLQETLYPFFLHVQINTGWNVESILALTDDLEAHVTDDLIDPENYVVIQSVKTRGQKNGVKTVFHKCSRDRKFSTYNLLKYVQTVVTQYKDSPHYHPGRLWQFAVRSHSFMTQLISYYGCNTRFLFDSSKLFLRRHKFTYFNESTVDHGRIRTSYETLRELQGLPLAVISYDMGHSDVETTSTHYASDITSNAVKDLKIAECQEQIVDDLQHYQCKIAESLSLIKLRDSIHESQAQSKRNKSLVEAEKTLDADAKTVLHLISPEGQTYIAACRDACNPTWPGHQEYLKPGQLCRFFNKCAMCKQAVIFPEALPYAARRILDLEQLKKKINQFEWLSGYGEEWDAWNGVMEDWSDREQVAAARQAAVRGEVILPIQLKGA